MNKHVLISTLLFLSVTSNAQLTKRFSISANWGIGTDIGVLSKGYNVVEPIYIPSGIKPTMLRIQQPLRYTLGVQYKLNNTFSLIAGYSNVRRAMRYWSLDSTISSNNCGDCKLKLPLVRNNAFAGIRIHTPPASKPMFYFGNSLGYSWGRKSHRFRVNDAHPQAEAIAINNGREHRLIQVYYEEVSPIINLHTTIGAGYPLNKKLMLEMGLSFDNELTQGSSVHIHGYDPALNSTVQGYNANPLEFKSVYAHIGVRWQLK